METFIMAIDQGTTSTRAILFNHESEIIAVAQKELHTYYPNPGWVEQDANELWASCAGVISEVCARANIDDHQIAAIGITNQRETTVVWDQATGTPIYSAIVWQSRQSNAYCEERKDQGYEELVQDISGLCLDPYFSASKIRWILDHVEGSQRRAERGELLFGTIDTWLLWKLTNGKQHKTDVSNASRTMLMNLETLQWDERLLTLWNIPLTMLPKICDTSECFGYSEGIWNHAIPICALVGDQQAALFGQTCFDAGDVKNTYGTGCFLLMNTKNRRIRSQHGLVACAGWRIQGVCDYVLEGSVFVAGAAIQWLRDGLSILSTSAESETRAMQVPDSNGVYFVPSFTGLGAPYWKPDVTGAIVGLTRGTTQAHIIRAALESLAYQTYDVLMAMRDDSALDIHRLQVDGGASQNNFLLQFQSDLLQCAVIRCATCETTALGAAYLAGLAIGYWKDLDELRKAYKVSSEFHQQMDEKIREKSLAGWHKAIKSVMAF